MSKETSFKPENENPQTELEQKEAAPQAPDDYEGFFADINLKFEKYLYGTLNFFGEYLHKLPVHVAESMEHTLQTVFGGFAVGFSLYLLQFTWDERVNKLMHDTREQFIEHYSNVPIDILTAALLFVSVSLVLTSIFGRFLRRFFISPIFLATAHGFALTAGMALSVTINEISGATAWKSVLMPAVGVILISVGFSFLAQCISRIVVGGVQELFEPRKDKFKKLVPKGNAANTLTTIFLIALGMTFAYLSWNELKSAALRHETQQHTLQIEQHESQRTTQKSSAH